MAWPALPERDGFVKSVDGVGERHENDAEHSWHIAVMALLFKEYCVEEPRVERAVKMCVVHDLIEIYAGDTFAYNVDEVIEYTNRIHPRMLLLASPNNPTGNSLTSEEIGRIMENIPGDTMVLVDEAYASFITTDTDYIAPLVNKYSNLIISRTLSKFYGLPGLRTGFGFIGKGHDQFLSYSNKYLGFNRFSEAVALAALESDEHYRRVADEMEWDRQLFQKELGNLPGFKVYKSVANFILIKYPIEIKEALQKALADQNYKIKFMTDKGLESCLRITLGRKEQIQVVVDTIKRVFLNK